MQHVIVHVLGKDRRTYEFLEDTLQDARRLAEQIAQCGFWIEDIEPATFVPSGQIELVEVIAENNQKPSV